MKTSGFAVGQKVQMAKDYHGHTTLLKGYVGTVEARCHEKLGWAYSVHFGYHGRIFLKGSWLAPLNVLQALIHEAAEAQDTTPLTPKNPANSR